MGCRASHHGGAQRHAFRSGNFQPNLATQNVRQGKGSDSYAPPRGLDERWQALVDGVRFFDRQRGALSDEERNDLIADLEQILLRFSDVSVTGTFDPQIVKHAAQRLIRHYTRLRRPDDVRRLYQTVARVTEDHAALSDAMLAYVLLQESLDFYKQAGLREEAEPIRFLMQEKIDQAPCK
jgi:hypothetical protein